MYLNQSLNYTQFFASLQSLTKQNLISSDEKTLLKHQLISNHPPLVKNLINDQDLDIHILSYIQNNIRKQQPQQFQRKKIKSKTYANKDTRPQSPATQQQTEFDKLISEFQFIIKKCAEDVQSPEKNEISPLELQLNSEKLIKLQDIQKDIEEIFSQEDIIKKQYNQQRDYLIKEVKIEADDYQEFDLIGKIKEVYRRLKKIYWSNLHTHQILLEDELSYQHIFLVIQYILKNLIDADQFSFIIEKNNSVLGIGYSTLNDFFIEKKWGREVIEWITSLQSDYLFYQATIPKELEKILQLNKYQDNYTLATQINIKDDHQKIVFFFHYTDVDPDYILRKFLNANTFNFVNVILELSTFLKDVIFQARIQVFNPLSFADQIQNMGINFLRISKFILAEISKEVLQLLFPVTLLVSNFQESFNSPDLSSRNEIFVKIEIKDEVNIELRVQNMNLINPSHQIIYREINQIFDKFQGFFKQCYEKLAYYKYFLRTKETLLFDFNKNGELVFLNRPITDVHKKSYDIEYNSKEDYYKSIKYIDVFAKNKKLIQSIQKQLNINLHTDNQQPSNSENSQFEIYMKIINKHFKGFTVIFHEEFEKRIQSSLANIKLNLNVRIEDQEEILKKIRKEVNKIQTSKFLNQLVQQYNNQHELNPDAKNSMIQMFMPDSIKQAINISRHLTTSHNESQEFQQSPTHLDVSSIKKSQLKNYKQFDLQEVFTPWPDPSFLDEFEFDIFKIPTLADKHKIVWGILERNQFISKFLIQKEQLKNFLIKLEYKYNKKRNPFHNYDHGIAVMQSSHKLNLIQIQTHNILSIVSQFALIFGSLCHDIGHTGRTNIFEVNSQNKLALRYHDRSVLEQHHAALSFKILKMDSCNVLKNLTFSEYSQFRKEFIQNILYTDIKEHFNLLKVFEARVKESYEVINVTNSSEIKLDQIKKYGSQDDDIKFLTGMMIHSADFNGGAKVFETSRIWSELVNREFIAQYKEEQECNLTPTIYMKDLDKISNVAKQEIGFFKIIVKPLWMSLSQFFNFELEECVKNLSNTILEWEMIYKTEIQKLNQK